MRCEEDVHGADERRHERSRALRSRPRFDEAPRDASGSVRLMHDVVVVGAGCTGMRAAIEAFDTGANVGVVSNCTPRGVIRARRRAASTRRSATPPRTAREARVRHREGLRLPGRPGRDRDPRVRGARRHLPARALGLRLLAERRGHARATAVRRGRFAAHRVLRRHHGPRPHPRALRAAHEAPGAGPARSVRGVLRVAARDRGRRCVSVICWISSAAA